MLFKWVLLFFGILSIALFVLSKAIAFYFRAFNRDRSNNIWQGINYVALLVRARPLRAAPH